MTQLPDSANLKLDTIHANTAGKILLICLSRVLQFSLYSFGIAGQDMTDFELFFPRL